MAPRYGNYAEPHDIGVRKRYKVDGQVCGCCIMCSLTSRTRYMFNFIVSVLFVVQDLEVIYFHAYIDGVDFVFIDNNLFHHHENNIYGGAWQVNAY